MVMPDIRTSLSMMYEDSMDVISTAVTVDTTTGISSRANTTTVTDIPCRISFDDTQTAVEDNAAVIEQKIEVFCAPDVAISEGDKLRITRNNEETLYQCAGKPAKYKGHQEVLVKLAEEYA